MVKEGRQKTDVLLMGRTTGNRTRMQCARTQQATALGSPGDKCGEERVLQLV